MAKRRYQHLRRSGDARPGSGNRSPPKPNPASGEKLVKQIDRFAAASRNGKGN